MYKVYFTVLFTFYDMIIEMYKSVLVYYMSSCIYFNCKVYSAFIDHPKIYFLCVTV